MMLHLCYLTFSLLWSLSFFSSGLAIQCSNTEYEWPISESTLCCKKCPPGQRYSKRSPTTCDIECKPCDENRYADTYSLEANCNVCDVCKKANFEVASNCTPTQNTVCKCRAGYRCSDASCTFCEPVPTTTQPTPPPSTAVAGSTSTTKTTVPPNNKIRDTQWFLVIIVLLCAGIALVVVTKIKPILHWIRSNHGYFLPEKIVTAPLHTVEEDVSKPVQEVCGKCDHCIDLCMED